MTIPLHTARIAFQGERGAFSEEAAIALLGHKIQVVPRPTFEALFASIEDGLADYVLAPLENSLAGSVHRVYDLLLETSLSIIGEVVIPIEHHLIACPGSPFQSITTVESHPTALAQCEKFFAGHPHLKRVVAEDTAGSVAAIINGGDLTRAAVAGRRAAEIYGGAILRDHLEDHPQNYTRFGLLSNAPTNCDHADKLSLVMKLKHRPGALQCALAPFARRGINLLKIESRPVKGQPWQYYFYLDLETRDEDRKVEIAITELEKLTESFRILGNYPSWREANNEEPKLPDANALMEA